MTRFEKVFTAVFFDEDMDIIGESPELESCQLAQLIGEIVSEMVPEVAYFAVEKYFKKIEADEVWR